MTVTATPPSTNQSRTEEPTTMTPNAMRPDTMRAVTQDRYGNAEVLDVSTVAVPAIGPDEVLIEVHAAGVDRGTEHLMTGLPYAVRLAGYGIRAPKDPVIGLDVAGVVVEIGSDVTRFAVGDAVFGIARGSFAEYAAAKAEKLAHTPAGVTHAEAAASSVSGITALQALTDVGGVTAGQRVLVLGASGGVGSFAVQIGAARGAIVTGVAGAANLDLVRSLGASAAYDYRSTPLSELPDRYDLVIVTGGAHPVRELRRIMTSEGTLVIVGAEGGNRFTGGVGRQFRAALRSPFVSHSLKTFISTEHHSFMERLAEDLASGAVTASIGATYDLDHAPDAMRDFAASAHPGKSVILVRPDASDPR